MWGGFDESLDSGPGDYDLLAPVSRQVLVRPEHWRYPCRVIHETDAAHRITSQNGIS